MCLDYHMAAALYASQVSGRTRRSRVWTHLLQPRGTLMHCWDADIILPQTLAICRRPDGTPWHLGCGSFGQVVKGVRDGVHEVALKISRPGLSRELIMREMSLLKSCKNSNIVQFLGVCHRRDSLWLVMEYMPGGDLHSFLKRQKNWSWGPR
eukprot:jgi/Botrbrau1/23625/Bobra.55_2s0016.1